MKSDAEISSPKFPMQVLLVEDSELNQLVTQRLLNEIGYHADIADSGIKAIEAVKNIRYDLVLMDVNMPELDGLEATRRIRALTETPSPVVIAMTGMSTDEDRERCLAAGMNDFVCKPFEPSEFQETIEKWGERIRTGGDFEESARVAKMIAAGAEAAPVNIQRMEQFSDGTATGLRELVDLYLEQTAGHMIKLEHAIVTENDDAIRHFAHKGYGSSSICGMDALAQSLREIELEITYRKNGSIKDLFARSQSEFNRVQAYLEERLAALPN